MAEWVRALACTGDRVFLGSNPAAATSPLRNFGNSAYPGPFYLGSIPGGVEDSTSPHWNV